MDIVNFPAEIAKRGLLESTGVVSTDDLLIIGKKVNNLKDGSQYQNFPILVEEFLKLSEGIPGPPGPPGPSGTSGLETSTRYSPTFQATGMTFTGSGTTYPTYNSYYVKAGLLVSFVIEIDFTTVTNFGTGQYKVALPFAPAFAYNHFNGWIWADPNVNPDTGTGHTILNADTSGITTVLDLHYLKQSGGANSPIREGLWLQDLPVPLTTISKAYINGTYISAT